MRPCLQLLSLSLSWCLLLPSLLPPARASDVPFAAPTGVPAELGRVAPLTAPAGNLSTGGSRIEGRDTSPGARARSAEPAEPCILTCPPGGQAEGEPPCGDGYYDVYNGGCQQVGWTPIYAETGDCGVICGRSCTFTYGGFDYRDTDWYTTAAVGGPVTVTCTAEFPVQLILLRADCLNFEYIYTQGEPCEAVSLTWDFTADEETWVWVGPSVFTGVPESDYVLEVCGVHDPGACCFPSGGCHVGAAGTCEEWGGVFLGWGTHCDPNPCGVDPPGACCLPGGACAVLTLSACGQSSGNFLGAGTDCEPNPCEATPVSPASWGRIKRAYR